MSDLSENGIPLEGMQAEKNAIHLMLTGYERNCFNYAELEALCHESLFPAKRYFKRGSKASIKKLLEKVIPEEGFDLDTMLKLGLTEEFKKDLKNKDCTNLNMDQSKFKYITKLFDKYGYHANPVHIATIHQFKGMEADNIVLVPDITKSCYENESASGYDPGLVESERRVWYTAITRARKKLIILDRTDYSNYKTKVLNLISETIDENKKPL